MTDPGLWKGDCHGGGGGGGVAGVSQEPVLPPGGYPCLLGISSASTVGYVAGEEAAKLKQINAAVQTVAAAQRKVTESMAELCSYQRTLSDAVMALQCSVEGSGANRHSSVSSSANRHSSVSSKQVEVQRTLVSSSCFQDLRSSKANSDISRAWSEASKLIRCRTTTSSVTSFASVASPLELGHRTRKAINREVVDYLMGAIIFANSICIGIEITLGKRNKENTTLSLLEHLFLIIYIIELIFRIWQTGWGAVRSRWILFETFLVATGIIASWIVGPLVAKKNDGQAGSVGTGLQQVVIIRILRLMRLVRCLRLLGQFKTLWRLVVGLYNSVGTMLSTCALLLLALYVFACVGVEFLAASDPPPPSPLADAALGEATMSIGVEKTPSENGIVAFSCCGHSNVDVANKHFSSIPSAMMTLVQFVTSDSMSVIYWPLVTEQPVLALYFFPIVLIISVALMNLVTAVLVEGAIKNSRDDTEVEKTEKRARLRCLIPGIRDAFRNLDANQDGVLEFAEVMDASNALPPLLLEIVKPETMLELFEMLNVDGSGRIEEVEFVDVLLQMALREVPLETIQILKILRTQRRKFGELELAIQRLEQHSTPRTPR